MGYAVSYKTSKVVLI